MTTFAPYLVQADFGGVHLDVQSCSRSYRWTIQQMRTPGTDGDRTTQHGRESVVDQVVALVDLPTLDDLITAAGKAAPQVWQHPLRKPMWAHILDMQEPVSADLDGYVLVTFTVVEHRPLEKTQLLRPSAASSRAKADSAFADLGLAMDDVGDDVPGTAGSNLDEAWGDLSSAYGALSLELGAMDDGESMWRDLSRQADTVASAATDLIDAVREAEEYVEGAAQDIIEGTENLVQTARDAVDAAETFGADLVTFTITAATDIYGLILDAGLEITDKAVTEIMSANRIEDPFYLMPGMDVTLPTRLV